MVSNGRSRSPARSSSRSSEIFSLLAAIGLTLLPDPPQQGRPLEVRVPLGVGAFQAASMRICHQQGVPIAEVLLVQGAGGVWSGVIDGRYLRGPRLGLWIRVRQQGSYRAVLGGVDDPVWIDVALEALEVRPSSGPGGVALLAIQKSNQRPAFGFADYSPGRELPRLLDQESDLFSRRRVDGRVVVMRHGRASDRAVSARLDLLEIIDPYDGSLVDFIYIEPGFSTRKDAFGFALRRHSPAGLSARVAGGTPGRGRLPSTRSSISFRAALRCRSIIALGCRVSRQIARSMIAAAAPF